MTNQGNAAIYCRISRDTEGDAAGVQRQEAACRELADRLGLTVGYVYTDNDVGASDRTHKSKVREQYNELLLDARAGIYTHILAYSNSRLTRRMSELSDLVELVKDHGVSIHTVVSGDYDLASADGLLIAQILTSVDAAESNRISERQKAAFRANALKGIPKLQRQRAFGWQADGLTLEPQEASLIRDAVSQLIEGESITGIARQWESAGVLTAAGKEKWEWSPLQKVLVGWRTAGVRTYRREPMRDADGKLVMGTWEPIITLEERDAALAMLGNRSLKKIRQGTWLLSGLVTCGECGASVYGQVRDKKSNTTYACKRGDVAINAVLLEDFVESGVNMHVFNRNVLSQDQAPVRVVEPWPKEERLATVAEKISELMNAFNADRLPGSIVFPQVEKLTQEQKDLRSERDRYNAEHAEQIAPATIEDRVHAEADAVLKRSSSLFEERAALMRRELRTVIVKKGVQGRAYRGDLFKEDRSVFNAVAERVEILYRDEAQ
ncbi:recombinase family protein [Microbacterium enclense]|uniref:recombinase family protein n=1 Tax=Microbacterium enclense TaxID=993073 RepID=UPI00203E7393|nr:recombinase family protein [Microbacterium enclense]MCM3615711.1 recombinase family protein [Microbacterium enclense]